MPFNLFTQSTTVIAPYTGYRSADRLHVSARVLRRKAQKQEQRSGISKFLHLLSLYASREVRGKRVTLKGYGEQQTLASDREGFVHFSLNLADAPLARHAAWEEVLLTLSDVADHVPVPAPILAPGTDNRLGIISDIDDTIIETGATDFLRNWRRVLAELPDDRIMVPGSADIYRSLGAASRPDTDAQLTRPFFYISSSPWNLYGFLSRFMKINNIPPGVLMLRDWGFNRETLGSKSHGAHKLRQIHEILTFYPAMHFILIGDDTQGDALAFAQIVEKYPRRIAAVFLRTAGDELSGLKRAAVEAIKASSVPIWTGTAFDAGHEFLASLKLEDMQQLSEIVDTMEETE